MLQSHNLRLVLWCITREKKTAVNLMGPSCSSWGVPNRGTSLRSFINFRGQEAYASVSSANVMISRTLAASMCACVCVTHVSCTFKRVCFISVHLSVVLAILVMTAMHATWVLEHPSCSLLHKHNRFEWLVNSVLYATWSYSTALSSRFRKPTRPKVRYTAKPSG